jgi:hypothetical protein
MLLMAAAPAAELITVEFNGVVTVVTDPNGDLQNNVGIGDPVVGLFTYDETIPDEHTKPDVGRYRFQGSQAMCVVTAGGLLFASDTTSTNITIKVTNDKKTNVLKDQYEFKSTSNHDALPGVGVLGINILLVDETAIALSSDALANQRPDEVTWFPTRTLVLTGVDGWIIEAEIELIDPSDSIDQRREAKKDFQQQ